MKKNITLVILVLLFISLVIFVKTTLQKDIDWVSNKMHQIEQSFYDYDESISLYNELDELWKNRQIFWGMLLPHNNLEEITKEIKILGVSLKNRDKQDADTSISTINLIMNNLLHRNTLRWDHIL